MYSNWCHVANIGIIVRWQLLSPIEYNGPLQNFVLDFHCFFLFFFNWHKLLQWSHNVLCAMHWLMGWSVPKLNWDVNGCNVPLCWGLLPLSVFCGPFPWLPIICTGICHSWSCYLRKIWGIYYIDVVTNLSPTIILLSNRFYSFISCDCHSYTASLPIMSYIHYPIDF